MTVSLCKNVDLPSLVFPGQPVPETTTMKLLGVTFDAKLSFHSHIGNVATRAHQPLGLLSRAAPLLCAKGRLTVYNGFVRPTMEYAPLVWMGAAPSHLALLDKVQACALKTIGPDTILQTLQHRRTVSALCYMYKLLCCDPPPQLASIVPAPRPALQTPVTRAQHVLSDAHPFQLSLDLPVRCPNLARRPFPHCVVELWSGLHVSSIFLPPHRKDGSKDSKLR